MNWMKSMVLYCVVPLPEQKMAVDPSNPAKWNCDMTTFIPATPFNFKLLERYGVETKAYRSYWTQSYCLMKYFDGKRLSREFDCYPTQLH
jgi:hypothetical protein